MATKLVVALVVEALDGRFLDRSVHAFDLAIGPGMLGLGETVIDIVPGAGQLEGMSSEEFLAFKLGLNLSRSPTVAAGIGEVDAVVGEDRVDFVRNGFDEGSEEVRGHLRGGPLMKLSERKLRRPINGYEEVQLALLGSDLGNIDVEVSDRIGFELALGARAIFHVWQPGYSMALKTAVKG